MQLLNLQTSQQEELAQALASTAKDHCARSCTIAGKSVVLTPLYEDGGGSEIVLAVEGTLADLPRILHEVHGGARHFSQVVHLLPQIVLTARPNGRFDYASRRWFEITGAERSVCDIDTNVLGAIDERDVDEFQRIWQAKREERKPFAHEFRLKTVTGSHWHELRAAPAWEKSHRLGKWIVALTDVNEAVTARLALTQWRVRLDALAEVGRLLLDVTSFSDTELIRRVLDVTLSAFGAACVTCYHEGNDGPIFHASPAQTLLHLPRPETLNAAPLGEDVIRSQALWKASETRPALVARVRTEPGRETDSTLTVIGASSDTSFTQDDATLLGEIAARLGAALRSAAAYHRERRVAHVLQRAMLPIALPQLSGISFDVTYRVADDEALVGGDWYDAFETPNGKIAIVLGDVAGHGVDASVVMGHVRERIRATALEGSGPSKMLENANRTALAGRSIMVTAFVALLDPHAMTLEYANAGHPHPFAVATEGYLRELDSNDVALGVTAQACYRVHSISLHDVSALVLYTDGLVEAKRNLLRAEERLRRVLAQWALDGFREGARTLADTVLDDALPRDDVALLLIRFQTLAREARSSDSPSTASKQREEGMISMHARDSFS